jgi:hypothetical protein
MVAFYGDSITWQARAQLEWETAAQGLGKAEVNALGGTAPCDMVPSITKRLRSKPKVDRLVIEFYGNSLTPCMGAPVTGEPGLAVGSKAFIDNYRTALAGVAKIAKEQLVPVTWAVPPPRHHTDPDPALNDRLAAMARGFGWSVDESGSRAVSAEGAWTKTLPCLSVEKTYCGRDGRIAVRSDDLVHFQTVAHGTYDAGARRWASALVTGLL